MFFLLGARTAPYPMVTMPQCDVVSGCGSRRPAAAPAAGPRARLGVLRRLERRPAPCRRLPLLQGVMALSRRLDEDLEQQEGVVEPGLAGQPHPVRELPLGLAQALEADQGLGDLQRLQVGDREPVQALLDLLLDHDLDIAA